MTPTLERLIELEWEARQDYDWNAVHEFLELIRRRRRQRNMGSSANG